MKASRMRTLFLALLSTAALAWPAWAQQQRNCGGGATWTVVLTSAAEGVACITAEGTNWQALKPEPDQGQGL